MEAHLEEGRQEAERVDSILVSNEMVKLQKFFTVNYCFSEVGKITGRLVHTGEG